MAEKPTHKPGPQELRRMQQRQERLDDMQKQIEDGSLQIRQLTDEEREKLLRRRQERKK